ncbi:hypothetical protein ACLKA6_012269 [Drosophila palustris]
MNTIKEEPEEEVKFAYGNATIEFTRLDSRFLKKNKPSERKLHMNQSSGFSCATVMSLFITIPDILDVITSSATCY